MEKPKKLILSLFIIILVAIGEGSYYYVNNLYVNNKNNMEQNNILNIAQKVGDMNTKEATEKYRKLFKDEFSSPVIEVLKPSGSAEHNFELTEGLVLVRVFEAQNLVADPVPVEHWIVADERQIFHPDEVEKAFTLIKYQPMNEEDALRAAKTAVLLRESSDRTFLAFVPLTSGSTGLDEKLLKNAKAPEVTRVGKDFRVSLWGVRFWQVDRFHPEPESGPGLIHFSVEFANGACHVKYKMELLG